MKDTGSAAREDRDPNNLFEDLFVLELANNHWGSVERGKEIIRQHGKMVKECGVKAAVKFQFRDVDTFIHNAFKPQTEVEKEGEVVQAPGSSSRYIKKTIATKLTPAEFSELLKEVRKHGMLTMATPFDEKSVEWCRDLDIDIVKIASQDAKSWVLVERIVELGKPAIISNGGTDIADLDRVVALFERKGVPLAINHCVSLYPSEDNELELNQVDYLINRYPRHVIGYSTHEYHDWSSSVQITYAKGARTWERHIDIEDAEGTPVSKYCSLPHQVREWFASFNKAKEMSGGGPTQARLISDKEKDYVQSVSRGAYALKDLPEGTVISKENVGIEFEFVIPLQSNQLSSRDLDEDLVLQTTIKKGEAITFDKMISSSPITTISLTKDSVWWSVTDGLTRSLWIGSIVLSVTFLGFWLSISWLLLSAGLLTVVAGYIMTARHKYELYPGLRQAVGAFINGIILSGILVSIVGLVVYNSPIYMPWVVLAVTMVATAIFGRLSRKTSSLWSYTLGLLLFGVVVTVIGYTGEFNREWVYFAYIAILLMVVEQANIRLCNTGVLLPWVQLFWQGVALLSSFTAVMIYLSPQVLLTLLVTPVFLSLISLLSGLLLVVSVYTRIRMRKTSGLLSQKRMIGVGLLAITGAIISTTAALPLLFMGLMVASLAFGDRTK